MMDNYILDWGALALLSSATTPRAQLIIISPQPAETSQTECSRWGSPAQTQTTFARRAVTRRDLDAQLAAKTQLTSDVHNPINAFTPVYIVIVIHNVIWEKMRIWTIASYSIKTMMQRLADTKYPNMPPSDAREYWIVPWKHLPLPAMETSNVWTTRMKNFAINPQLS